MLGLGQSFMQEIYQDIAFLVSVSQSVYQFSFFFSKNERKIVEDER